MPVESGPPADGDRHTPITPPPQPQDLPTNQSAANNLQSSNPIGTTALSENIGVEAGNRDSEAPADQQAMEEDLVRDFIGVSSLKN
eukprot:3332995-Rhodomonas_salina.1